MLDTLEENTSTGTLVWKYNETGVTFGVPVDVERRIDKDSGRYVTLFGVEKTGVTRAV